MLPWPWVAVQIIRISMALGHQHGPRGAQTPGIGMTFGDITRHGPQHRPQLQYSHGPTHGPQLQLWPYVSTALGGSAGHSELYGLDGSRDLRQRSGC